MYLKKANQWRDQYNPLRNLNITQLVSLLEAGERGAYADLQWLYRMIEKRDSVLRAGKRRRSAALTCLSWKIKIVEELPQGATQQMAEAQAAALQDAYNAIDNIKEAIQHLASAEFRGFAHLEKHFDENGSVFHLEPVPQWNWVRNGINGDWQYNQEARSGVTKGIPIVPQNFIIREVEDPINEIAVISFLRRNLSQKDWDGFIEAYGIPPLFLEMPANIPEDKAAEFQMWAEAVVADARGTLPNGSKIQTADAGARGTNPFKEHITYQDQQVVLAITGGKLTMLNDPTGLGSGQSEVHKETFQELAEAEAAEISEVFQQTIDQPVLDAKFGNTPTQLRYLAYFELGAVEQSNTKEIIDDAVKLSQAGYKINLAELSEKTGYTLEQAPAQPSYQPQFSTNRATPNQGDKPNENDPLVTQAIAEALGVRPEWLAPLNPWLNELIKKAENGEISDEDLLDFVEKSVAQLPELYADLNHEKLADVLEAATGTSVVRGLKDMEEKKS